MQFELNLNLRKFFFLNFIYNLKNLGALRQSTLMNNEINKVSDVAQEILDLAIFVPWEYCPNCYRGKKMRKITIEDILGGFKKDDLKYVPNNLFFNSINFSNNNSNITNSNNNKNNDFVNLNNFNSRSSNNNNNQQKNNFDDNYKYSVCSFCYAKFIPHLYIVYENQQSFDCVDVVELRSPMALIKNIDSLIEQYGEKYLFVSDYYNNPEHRIIFWNIAYYFQLFNLPNFVMSLQKNEEYLNKLVEDLKFIRENPKKRNFLNTNGSVSNRVNSVGSELTSRKQSTASNDASSIFSSPTVKTNNIVVHEKNLLLKM